MLTEPSAVVQKGASRSGTLPEATACAPSWSPHCVTQCACPWTAARSALATMMARYVSGTCAMANWQMKSLGFIRSKCVRCKWAIEEVSSGQQDLYALHRTGKASGNMVQWHINVGVVWLPLMLNEAMIGHCSVPDTTFRHTAAHLWHGRDI